MLSIMFALDHNLKQILRISNLLQSPTRLFIIHINKYNTFLYLNKLTSTRTFMLCLVYIETNSESELCFYKPSCLLEWIKRERALALNSLPFIKIRTFNTLSVFHNEEFYYLYVNAWIKSRFREKLTIFITQSFVYCTLTTRMHLALLLENEIN
jgi:hypothetical protein